MKSLGLKMFCTHFRCTIKPVMNQIEFNPYCCDNDILAVCKENGIVVQAFAPIGSGARPGRGKALGETQLGK